MVESEDYVEESIIVLTATEKLLSAQVIEMMKPQIFASVARSIVISLRNVEYFVSGSLFPDACPIGALLRLNRILKDSHRRLMLCDLRPRQAEVFHILRLDELLEIQADLAAARRACGLGKAQREVGLRKVNQKSVKANEDPRDDVREPRQ